MVVAYGIEDFRGNARCFLQHVVAGCRMRFDDGSLLRVKAPGLVKDDERNSGFADIMEHRGRMQPFDIGPRQPKAQANIDSNSDHEKTMLVGALMIAAHGFK